MRSDLTKVVHKKYTFKVGKRYGPYLYENKRVGKKVVTTYVGKENLLIKKPLLYFILIAIILIFSIIIIYNPISSPTGRAVLDIFSSYNYGEPLEGTLSFSIKSGELIPADSIVKVSLGEQQISKMLSSLVSEQTINGTFFAEDAEITGSGEGFGVLGNKSERPQVFFQILVSPSIPSGSEIGSNETNQTEGNVTLPEENATLPEENNTEEPQNNESEPSTPSEEPTEPSEEPSPPPETQPETPPESPPETPPEPDLTITGSATSESFTVDGNASKESDFVYSLNEQTAEIVSGSVHLENGTILPDSAVVLEQSDNEVRVSTALDFTESGFGAEFLGDKALVLEMDLSEFEINMTDTELVAEIEYNNITIARVEKNISLLNIPENVTINETNVTIIYNVTQISDLPVLRIAANSSAEIDFADYFEGAESYAVDVSDISVSIAGSVAIFTPALGFFGSRQATVTASAGSESIDADMMILVSSGAISITTLRGKITVNEPVLWIKNVALDVSEPVTIELPVEAESISVKKINENGNEERALASVGGITGNVVNSMIVQPAKNDKIGWFASLLNFLGIKSITGNVVDEETAIENATEIPEDTPVNVTLADDATNYIIEYYTEAPSKTEAELPDGSGKIITVSGPDNLNYTDVIAFTNVNFSVREGNTLHLYWKDYSSNQNATQVKTVDDVSEMINADNLSIPSEQIVPDVTYTHTDPVTLDFPTAFVLKEIPFDAYSMHSKKTDYAEWVVPHLSNQTFILTEKKHITSCLSYCLNFINAQDRKLVVFDSEGNFDVAGNIVKNTSQPILPGQYNPDFRIGPKSYDSIAFIDSVTGDFHLKGNVFENQDITCPELGQNKFMVNITNCVAYIDDSGNLFIKGSLNENAYL
jgi:hypothetical protein